ncbi:sulfur transfer protein [Candidatus Blochmanniella pennsylvanica str. BPEN]|uniref:tRNA sulfurtransferase n=1 Tax=Blochmanniella pennsylvanica (strain BPEN) TaxID=291272 RepID=THII_BLOPB|nr:tRNA uracil 4-sulfurtransferase ThiI [Candidatus Blochmannia pennsylvanicus]Q493G5.1 RecName: Full=tRNA sulfurtransferase; AltName: Full=Sulfur carrier protein ThiS sulfurtransferase; AltName: Full=Thiamine biosynthesis protein ThiI; AltName: Full=tRNA 4-thiouridine synthase [Candidatus Blochmannia pennsylvanicus str. BPEN]AAZ40877.1 sulfur transfer protein [Candidatus Blochmannia pennsylvanicus str. BPEN]UOY04640.1 tRNA 4-thiouridine(8) synthase ThiI [Candidatus Blochmannia pennsylvanicus]
MKIVIKLSPEITIKSRAIRIFFIKILITNIKTILKKNNESASIIRNWDYLEVICNHSKYQKICAMLINIPGIHHLLLIKKHMFRSLQDIYEKIILSLNYEIQLSGKSFCVRVKRCGKHNFTSQEVEHYLGNKLCQNIGNIRVNLTKPEKTIYLEIKDNQLFIIIKRYEGLGGFPIGTQQEMLSLISGGFDSAVASYMLIRRGCKVNYCFFNLGGDMHTVEVCRVIYFLWNKFSSSHKIKFISIDFSEVIKEITAKIKDNQIGVVLKRMMIRSASLVANRYKITALITGEVLGQVSSQTLSNLTLIDSVSDHVIFRPLIAYDKEKIIDLARKIGTEILSKSVPEYCGIISKKSTAKTTKQLIEFEENNFDFTVLNRAVSQSYVIDVQNIPDQIINQHVFQVETKKILDSTDVVLDIRTEIEQEKNPLYLNNIEIKKIPFYNLIDQFSKLDPNKIYLLYCDHGIMSRLQVMYLHRQGFSNVKIYRPPR